MEVLTQLHDATNRWQDRRPAPVSRSLPNLQRAKLPLEVVSWSVREVVTFLNALGLGEWAENFLTHRIQGDTMFSLKEELLKEMGVAKIGDRLYFIDCLQSLYEELTAWKNAREQAFHQKVQQAQVGAGGRVRGGGGGVPALPAAWWWCL